MSLTWLFCCYKDTQRIKCHVCTEVIYGYAPAIIDMKRTCTGFSELSAFSTVKRWKNKRPLGCSTIKAAPSSHAQLCSAENWDFCNSNLLPAWNGLCVYLFMTSWIPDWWSDSCQSTHTKIGSPSTHFQIFMTSVLILSSHSPAGVGV